MAAYPYCVFCGGTVPAETVDHVPPRAVFELKRRPRGLEFPACHQCNDGARLDELVAAMFSRVYPDSATPGASKETRRLIQSVKNNIPGLLEEMMPLPRQQLSARRNSDILPPSGGVLNCQGEILNRAIHRFGAKIGFALHFLLSGSPVPPSGATCVWWLTNYQAIKGDMPLSLLKMMGKPKTLKQGKWEVGEQFRYVSIGTEDGAMTAHFATFRFSFAICAFTAERANMVRPPNDIAHVTFHTPGWLQQTQ